MPDPAASVTQSVCPDQPWDRPNPLAAHEKMRIRTAAYRAGHVYPGPVGELLSQDLVSWEEFGYRLDAAGLVMRVVADVLRPREVRT